MNQAILNKTQTHSYHVTARCLNQEFFPLPIHEVWDVLIKELFRVHKDLDLAIHAFILMGNHFHLLCHTPKRNLNQIMNSLLESTSLIINHRTKKEGLLWEATFKSFEIHSQTNYLQVYRYIFQNPIRVGLSIRVQDYRFSSLNEVPFPLHSFVPLAFGGHEGEYLWLNQPSSMTKIHSS